MPFDRAVELAQALGGFVEGADLTGGLQGSKAKDMPAKAQAAEQCDQAQPTPR
jgi:hypothetical protein